MTKYVNNKKLRIEGVNMSMSEPLYQVVFHGVLRPGFTQDQVVQNLKDKLKLSDSITGSLFSSPRTIIKRNLPLSTARKYEQQFFLQGMVVKSELIEPEPLTLIDNEPTESSQQADITTVGDVTSSEPSPMSDSDMVSTDLSNESPDHQGAEHSDSDAPYPKVLSFEFHGNGKEYFKIWIVNILLTIVTLGIYSAWAKVRNKQYFYGNTVLDGASFEYTAKPLQILKGRLLAFAIVGVYYFCGSFLPPYYQAIFYGVAAVVFILIFPWVVVKGLQFNARHSNYRNINFGFDGTYWGAFKAFILWPIAGITVFLLPFSWHRRNHFFVDNSRYGTEPFQFSATTSDYYRIFGMVIALGFGVGIAALIAVFLGGFIAAAVPVVGFIVMGLAYAAAYFIVFAYFNAANNNLLYNSTVLKQHSLTSDYDVKSYAMLLFTNTLGIALTLGFFIPWAMVRTARYHAEKTDFIAAEDLNGFIAAEEQQVNTLAEGLADTHDMFDIDVGI